jgi:hypothetical protein
MALAYLSFTDVQNNEAQFYADAGVNTFYKYTIGNAKTNKNGVEVIDNVVHTSGLFEIDNANYISSRFLLTIPVHLFSLNSKYVQLQTFSNAQESSRTLSAVVRVHLQANIINDDWPLLQQQTKTNIMYSDSTHIVPFNKARHVGFSFQESTISKAMFWDTILDAARTLLPLVGNVLGGAGGTVATTPALGSTGASATTGGAGLVPSVLPIIQAVMELMRNNTGAPATRPASTAAPSSASSLSIYQKRKLQHRKLSKAKIIDGGIITGPLLASIAGPLLNILPTLMNQQNQAQNQRQLQEQNYLANLLAQSNQADLLRLMANNGALTAPPAAPPTALPASTPITAPAAPATSGAASLSLSTANNNSIYIKIDKQTPLQILGSSKYVYTKAGNISLVAFINTDKTPPTRPIPKGIIVLNIQKAKGLTTIFSKKFYIKNVMLNSMQKLDITATEINDLPAYEDLIVNIQFQWLDKQQKVQKSGVDTCSIYLTHNYILNNKQNNTGEVYALQDMKTYKAFWNKIWESNTTAQKKWEASWAAKYYITYNEKADSNGKIETKIQMEAHGNDTEHRKYYKGKLKSGLEVSATELNKLLPLLTKYSLLDDEKLQAFKTNAIKDSYNLSALTKINIKGKKEETGSLWAYPEISIATYNLFKIKKTNENGQVVEVDTETVQFPEMSAIHFVGLATETIK